MIDIAFVNETEHDTKEYEALIEKVMVETIQTEGLDTYYEVSVVFVTNEKIKEINREYRNKDAVTDVISFALMDEEEFIQEVEITTLGDIFISIDRAVEQASDYGHSIEREMGFLACHGLLHLLGYDHMEQSEEQEMFQKQEQILNQINLVRR
jgi:probable rRNA maturation factor